MKIPFLPERKAPYYSICLHVILHERLRNEGMTSFLSLHPNLEMYSVTVYSKKQDTINMQYGLWDEYIDSFRLGKLGYGISPEHMGYEVENISFASYEEGKPAIIRNIQNGKLSLIGASYFHLPYSEFYHSDKYLINYSSLHPGITKHWISVYGIDEQKALIYDGVPGDYVGSIQLQDFEACWRGDRAIKQLENNSKVQGKKEFQMLQLYEVSKIEQSDVMKLMESVATTVAFEYTRGLIIRENNETHYFGRSAIHQLVEDLGSYLQDDQLGGEHLSDYGQAVLEIKLMRYYYLDLLKDLVMLYGFVYEEDLAQFEKIVKRWEVINIGLMKHILRQSPLKKFLKTTIESIEQVGMQENQFFIEFLHRHSHISLVEPIKTIQI
ncbi:BtrH N-terminal domain-containing protein [Brevibacillus sp. 7WMA2]|uniref:BtrH N-terminal domain-containing protein n=1 Tax=Brevibacillus TaxID=55080 RepID=UPI0013A7977A|nr:MULTISPECIES: BtrH N-terminal domain-containing protein [Brevibacillus]MCR8996820.1 BtrH N-terminal domain-containing protein [Brevibacillus laterosporus]QIC07471.1 BtrH N-terminal domain-containing protein [Brevibacillus sp. 7WMA2]